MNMKRLVCSSKVAALDEKAQSIAHIPAICLMESAGLQTYLAWKPELSQESRLVFLCGGGNNGGDALVVARYAYNDGFTNIQLVYSGSHLSPSCETQRSIMRQYPISVLDWDTAPEQEKDTLFHGASWIVDGLVGTGLKGALKASLADLVERANASSAKCLAIDIPSAVGDEVPVSSTHIEADMTVTMGLEKRAMYHPVSRASCGRIVLVNPSFPPFLIEACKEDAMLIQRSRASLERLAVNAYKNSRGHVAILGGSKHYSGAARLSARSAFAARAGLVSLFCDPEVYPIAAADSASTMVQIYEGQDLAHFDALLAGPGWGDGREELLKVVLASGRPTILDADGIRAFASLLKGKTAYEHGPLLLTPHIGELRCLVASCFPREADQLGKSDTPSSFFTVLEKLATFIDATIVVKSQLLYIVSPGTTPKIIQGNNPSLGVAGSGDVLSGILVAMLAKSHDCHQVAVEGSLLHQRAGALASSEFGYYDSEALIGFVGKASQEAEQ